MIGNVCEYIILVSKSRSGGLSLRYNRESPKSKELSVDQRGGRGLGRSSWFGLEAKRDEESQTNPGK